MSRSGLTGNSGLVAPGVHIAAPYIVKDGFVFVEYLPRGERVPSWKRVRASKANPAKIIKCECGKPATHMDHHWPWMSDYTTCDECADSPKNDE